MIDNLSIALLITVLGMGLVFSAILLLWGVMALLVRLTADKREPEPEANPAPIKEEVSSPAARLGLEELELKRRAAAAAVAMALADHDQSSHLHEFPLPPTATVSPWQAVMRTKILTKRGSTR